LAFDLPGLSKDEIKIEFEDGLLSVWGERKNELDETKDGVHRQERYYGSFRRSFSLPKTVKADKITAKYENGVLKVEVPKIEETQKKTISIQ
jgi:HSP20 family protein